MAPAAIAAILYLPALWLALLAAAVMLLGLWEWLRLAGCQRTFPRLGWILITAIIAILCLLHKPQATPWLYYANTMGVVIWVGACIWLRYPRWGHHGLFLITGVAIVLSAWSSLLLIDHHQQGERWLLFALALVWAADSGAYFVGRRFGRTPLAQTISPNKTLEGALGGIVAGLIAAVVFGWFAGATPAQWARLLVAALMTIAASILGDLFESVLKRQAGMKDSGHLIPGHGGVLDRIDGVLAALPFFAFCQNLFL